MHRGLMMRWGWLVTTLALGLAAIGSAWINWRSTRQAANDLVSAQAEHYRDAVLATNRVEPTQRGVLLDSVLNTHNDGGLRFAAWVRRDGEVLSSGGGGAPRSLAATDIFTRRGPRGGTPTPPSFRRRCGLPSRTPPQALPPVSWANFLRSLL